MALQDLLGGVSRTSLISVDSAMIYRGMDIGTAKPNAAELEQHPLAMIDLRSPTKVTPLVNLLEMPTRN